MTINIQQERSQDRVNPFLLKHAVLTTLSRFKKPAMDITLRISNDKELQQLNKTYRGIDQPTDVLAFNHDYPDPETGSYYLGDIIISADRAMQQASENNNSLNEEMVLLTIHATLHLLGYDHQNPVDKEQMWTIQKEIVDNTYSTF